MSELLTTARLRLPSATVEELDSFIAGDRSRFEELLGAKAPEPFEPPPETADVLGWFRETIAADSSIRHWFFRWIVNRLERRLVGAAGFTGFPDDQGALLMGYSIYPVDEGNGYASEAVLGLVQWALRQDRVRRVRATISPGHIASERVAAKAGLTLVDQIETENEGMLGLWEVSR